MSHDIQADSHYVYALSDGLPWHGVGTQQQERMTLDDVIRFNPRFAETPTLHRIFYRDPSVPERSAKDCGNNRAIVFPSDGTFIGLATDGYEPRSYADAFRRVFGWVEQLGAYVSGAALLQGGKRAFIMARCPSLDFTVDGDDKHAFWLSVFAGSDGKTGITPHGTVVREVCANTVAAGLADAKERGARFSVAHHGNVDAKLDEASKALGQLAETRDAYQRAMGTLLAKRLGIGEQREMLSQLVPGDSTRASNARLAIERLTRTGKGNVKYAGTAYAMFQGVTDYVDHEAVKTSSGDVNERRFLYSQDGAGATLKSNALSLLLNGKLPRVPVAA